MKTASNLCIERVFAFLSPLTPEKKNQNLIQKIIERFSLFPGIYWLGFESPMISSISWMDLHIGFSLTPENVMFLRSISSLEPLKWEDPYREMFFFFLEKWVNDVSFQDQEYPQICLGFDIGSSGRWTTYPNIFFSIRGDPKKFLEKFEKILTTIRKKPFSATLHTEIQKSFARNSEIYALGFLIDRSLDGYRIAIKNTGFTDLHFLHSHLICLGIEGLNQEMRSILEKCHILDSKIHLGIDFFENTRRRIGLGCYIKEKNLLTDREEWDRFLEYLEYEGFISPKKRQAIISWYGADRSSHFFDDALHSVIVTRFIHHLKFEQTSENQVFIKAYLKFVVM